MDKLSAVGRTFVAISLVGLGIEHFVFREFITGRAPAWPDGIAGGVAWAYLTGAAFIVIGVMVLSGKKGRSAALLAAVLISFGPYSGTYPSLPRIRFSQAHGPEQAKH